jgi:hypothetical protein
VPSKPMLAGCNATIGIAGFTSPRRIMTRSEQQLHPDMFQNFNSSRERSSEKALERWMPLANLTVMSGPESFS